MIQIDTRDKPDKIKHITKYFDEPGIKWVRSKCVVGDYMDLSNPMVVIDRKQDLQEVCGNVCQQHERFRRELELAKELGYRLIVLIEEDLGCLENVVTWYNYRRKFSPKAISGKQLYGIMKTMSEKYGVEWEFCKKSESPKRILELLGGDSDSV